MSWTRVWLDPRDNTTEGHDYKCTLYFNGKHKWGPVGCHENTFTIKDALEKADGRFLLDIRPKEHSIEGHRAWISIQRGPKVYLEKLHTHENMSGLCQAVYDAQIPEDSEKASGSQQDCTHKGLKGQI